METLDEIVIDREKGIEFVEMCRDTNSELHCKGNVVQGIYLLALSMKCISKNKPKNRDVKLTNITTRFKSILRYNEPFYLSCSSEDLCNKTIITTNGKKHNGGDIINVKATYSEKIEAKSFVENSNYAKFLEEINQRERDLFYDSVGIKPTARDMRKFFLSTFIVDALCRYVDPNKLSDEKRPVFLKQELNFYKLPEGTITEMAIMLNKKKDTPSLVKIELICSLNGSQIIEGYSLFSKVSREQLSSYLKNA